MVPITVSVYTAEENGGDFEFLMPGDKCCDYTLSYGYDGSVFYNQKLRTMRLRSDLGPPKVNSLLIYPVLKGGRFLVGKTRKKTRQRLIHQKPDSSFRRDDDDDSGFDESYTWIRHAIISHYLGHCLKSIAIPVVQHIRGYDVLYSITPNLKVSENGKAPTVDSPFGMPAMEVFSVVINNNNQGCVSLYGTIAISMYDDAYNSAYIYEREREDSESIHFSPSADTTADTTAASLTLTGPSRLIHATDSLWTFFNLMVKNDTDYDDVFYKGKMYWNYFSSVIETRDDDEKGDYTSVIGFAHPRTAFGKPLAISFNGRSGCSVTINYVMLVEGLSANVEVTLLKMRGGGGDGAAAAHVYGLIQASSSCNKGFTDWSVVLLQKKKENNEYIGVRPGQLIPLSRSVVTVNACTSLKVSVELYDRLRDTDLSQDDDEIVVKGTVDFPAQLYGTSEENISGCYSEIKVKVTWEAA